MFLKKANNKKWQIVIKTLISLWLFYHLLVITILPHHHSMIYDIFRPYLISYAHSLSLDVPWNYFAPNPIDSFYFEYETVRKKTVRTYRWPPTRRESKKSFFNHNRLIYHALFFRVAGRYNVRKYFLPYLCHIHPTAKEVTAKLMVKNTEHFQKSKLTPVSYKRNKNWDKLFAVTARCRRSQSLRNIDSYEDE